MSRMFIVETPIKKGSDMMFKFSGRHGCPKLDSFLKSLLWQHKKAREGDSRSCRQRNVHRPGLSIQGKEFKTRGS